MANSLSHEVALDIINALRHGTVPSHGLHHLAVGIDLEIQTIQEQLEYVRTGRGDFKFIRGAYGAGKTFLASLALETALDLDFVVSQVVISVDTPLHKLDRVYYRLVNNLRTRGQNQAALKSLIDRWVFAVEDRLIHLEGFHEDDPALLERTEQAIESDLGDIARHNSRFGSALRGYYRAQAAGDYATAQGLLGWLSGEEGIAYAVKKQAGITGNIDNTTALDFLRGVTQVARLAGHAGLAVVFDEVETVQRLRTRHMREGSLNNLRQIVDAISAGRFPNTYFIFTGTPDFFEGRRGIPALQPLYERIKLDNPDDAYPNPRQPQLVLRPFDKKKLLAVAHKVRDIFEAAYGPIDRRRVSGSFIEAMTDRVTSKFGGRVEVVPRIFLREFVDVLDKVQQYPDYDPIVAYDFDLQRLKDGIGLSPEEEVEIDAVTF
jgi:adenosylhomocysteinase